MRRTLAAAFAALILGIGLVWTQPTEAWLAQVPAAAAAYTGPGDVYAFTAWYGLRCYSSTYASNVADIFDSATGNTTETLLTCSSGGTVNQTINSLATTCAVGCNVKTLYDQTAGNACAGSTTCNLAQATNASRPTINTNFSNSRPGMVFTPTQTLASANNLSCNQPYTVSLVAERTGAFTSYGAVGFAGIQIGFNNAANGVYAYAGAGPVTASATDSAIHAVQYLFKLSAAGQFYVDGSATTGLDAGSQNIVGAPNLGTSGGNNLTGTVGEFGIVCSDKSANFSTINTNQHGTNGWNF